MLLFPLPPGEGEGEGKPEKTLLRSDRGEPKNRRQHAAVNNFLLRPSPPTLSRRERGQGGGVTTIAEDVMRIFVLSSLGAALLLSLILLPVRQTERRMDAITGSIEQRTRWLMGIWPAPVITASPLEIRLRKMGLRCNRDWRTISLTDQTIFGNANRRACGAAPPIYPLTTVLAQFVAASDDQQIREFIRAMQVGTEGDQRKAVDEAGDRALGSTSTDASERRSTAPSHVR